MNRKNTVLLHILFWTVTLIATGLETIPSIGKMPINTVIWDYLIYALSYISVFYSFYSFISKKYSGKKFVRYLIIFGLIYTICFSVLFSFIYILVISPEIFSLSGSEFIKEYGKNFVMFLETNFIFAVSGSLIKIALLWYEDVMQQKEIEKQLVNGELALLKTRINPDFLVGTLNELKNLIEQSPETAIKIIENLSEIMSYMLYETKKDLVPLDKEIKCMNSYLFLQKIKFNPVEIKYNITGELSDKKIPPMLLLTFLDLVFNLESEFDRLKEIQINFIVNENSVHSEIELYYKENANQKASDKNIFEDVFINRLNLQSNKNYLLDMECGKDKNLFKFGIENINDMSSIK